MAKFQKGISGNPGGRPKEVSEVRELAREHTTEAIRTLAEIMADKSSPPAARVSAANALLDRGYGKSTTDLAVDGEDNGITVTIIRDFGDNKVEPPALVSSVLPTKP